MIISPRRSLILALAALIVPVAAEVRLPKVFTNGAVLQRDRAVPVWGLAEPGKKVTVRFGGQEKSTQAAPNGKWRIDLDAMPASSEGRTLEAAEENGHRLEVTDVLVGEVWLASGQSNMEWSIKASRQEDQDAAKAAPVPLLRIITVPKKVSPYRLEDFEGKWEPATPETVPDFSAVAYFFGRRLTEELGVPVGMIHSSWGGSRIEPWLADEGLADIADLREMKDFREARTPGTDKYNEAFVRHLAATRAWLELADRAVKEQSPVPSQPPAPPILPLGSNQALGTYQAMIHPVVPYALRGFIWYQGESNVGEDLLYTLKMEALIKGWRTQFNAPDAPFLFTQLAPYNYGAEREGALQGLWIAQQEALRIPRTGMAVTMDIGNPGDIHPRNKSEVGRRLALWALADTYGKQGIVKSGPAPEGFEVAGNAIKLRFKDAASGLATRDQQPPNSFEVAGTNWVFKPATAEISPNEPVITLKSAEVPNPVMARFAWSQVAQPNLMNKDGLPATAFHTHWPDEPGMGRNLARQKPYTSSDPNPHGWNTGLTDGNWRGAAGTCFATGAAPAFPKHVTIDLGRARDVQGVRFGVPGIGSTKTVVISLSENGNEFQEAGRKEFAGKTEARSELRFDKRPVRYVRATFPDHHPKQDNFDENFSFLSELEVYGPVQ